MSTNEVERSRFIEDALARHIPESRAWTRHAASDKSEYWIDVPSPPRRTGPGLRIRLRRDGDVQVEYHIASKRGSPFEMFFVVDQGAEAAPTEAVARFVADVLAERLVLGNAKGWLRGGRRFVPQELIAESKNRVNFHWISSWLGTFDWLIVG